MESTEADENRQGDRPATRGAERPSTDFLDWILFVVFLVAFLGTLVIYEIIQRLANLGGTALHQRSVRWLNRELVSTLSLVGTKIELERTDRIPAEGAWIAVSNHQSLFDIPLLDRLLAPLHPRFIAKRALGRWIPSVSFNLQRDGNGLIDRENPRQAIPEIKRVAALMREGRYAVVLFPEGTRARAGALKQFQTAGLAAILKAAPDTPLLPIAIDGSWRLASYSKGPIPRGQTVRIRVLDPIPVAGRTPQELSVLAREAIAQALDEMRSEA